jgi:hypothetical protein
MRASQQEQSGDIGQSEASANFARLKWGPVANPYHDLGTDLFLQVRDERGFDLGLLVGAQVKSGPTAFEEPQSDAEGELEGWWFRDSDRRHIDAWLRHSVPHLIVLHDLDKRTSYWAQVTAETVVSTGIGAKVFVPIGNVVDVSQREALLEVAGARQPGVAWEGSVWMAGSAILGRDRLRHALITPRLVAPHPNAGTEHPISADQAIAMLMQARLTQLSAFAEKYSDIPLLQHAGESKDWSWRLAGALYARAVHSELDPLLEVVADAPTAEACTAATVAAASGLIENARIPEALQLLDNALARDDAEAVDHAWLLVQRARARAEIGQLSEAQDDALGAQGVRLTVANDATATAIAASAAILLFNTSSWGRGDLRAMITTADTAANWWRTQTTAAGLWAVVERSFTAWNEGPETIFASGDPGHNNLAAAALMASHAGNHSGWRNLSGGVAQNDLLQIDRHDNPDDVAEALTMLRRAGETKALEWTVRHVVSNGPAAAATIAAAAVDLNASSRTTGHSDLTLLQHAGHVLDSETAEHAIGWLLGSLEDPSLFVARTTPSYLVDNQLIETLAGVVAAGGDTGVQTVIAHLLALDGVEHDLDARAWARVVRVLPDEAWADEDITRAREAADRHDGGLRFALLARASQAGDDAARATLMAEAGEGSLTALSALGDVRKLPKELITGQIAVLADHVIGLISGTHEGRHGIGSRDVGRELVLLNAWHPDAAAWDPVLEMLDDNAVIADDKRGALRLLADMAPKIPIEIRQRLKPIALTLARSDSAPGIFDNDQSVRSEAILLAAAIGAMDDTETAEHVHSLLRGDAVDRCRALALVDHVGLPEYHLGIPVALSGDSHPDVRATAAVLLAKHVEQGHGGLVVSQAVWSASRDPGTQVPEAVATTLLCRSTPFAVAIRDSLRDHPSARVRRAARETRHPNRR